MEGIKSPLQSKTIWGALIALIPVLDTALAVTGVLPAGVINDGYAVALGALGSFLAIYGRVKATKAIK